MFKIIQTLALVIMIVLFPPAALITVSQGSVQGDVTYPIKRWLEGQVLFLASFNPTTRALYAVAQANRRYEESAKLLSMGNNADSTLEELVTQSNIAAGDINQVSSSSQKTQLISDLSNSIVKYDQGLAEAQAQITRTSGVGSSQALSTPQSSIQVSIPSPSSPVGGDSTPAPSSVNQPTPEPSKINQPTPKPTVSPVDEEARKNQEAIEKARKELEELRKRLEAETRKLEQERSLQQNAKSVSSPSPTSKPSPSPSQSPLPSPSPAPVLTPTPSPSVSSGQSNKRKKGSSELNSQNQFIQEISGE